MPDSPVSYRLVDGVAVLLIDRPPVNAIGADVRMGLWEGLDAAVRDPAAQAVVIAAAGAMFSGGGDLREIGRIDSSAAISLSRLNVRIENFGKPVVIALHGRCIGGAVLLAMACHARVALADAQLALPELNLALIPGAGGTQRLPRLVGLRAALDMVVPARTVDAAWAEAAGLVDAVVQGDVLGHACSRARDIAAGRCAWRRTAQLPVAPHDAAGLDALRRDYLAVADRRFPGREAPAVAIDMILATAWLDIAQGFEQERLAYVRLAGAPQARALLHLFFAERDLAKRGGMDGAVRERIAQRLRDAAAAADAPDDAARWRTMAGAARACLAEHSGVLAADIDVVAVKDCGFPALLGGPLHDADSR